jgi:dsRNA-specific ribonuclease
MAKKEEVKSTNRIKNKSVSEDLLESVRGALYKLKGYLDTIDFTDEDVNSDKKATTMMSVIEKMGKSFETLAILEKKVANEEDLKGKVRGNNKPGLFEDGDN